MAKSEEYEYPGRSFTMILKLLFMFNSISLTVSTVAEPLSTTLPVFSSSCSEIISPDRSEVTVSMYLTLPSTAIKAVFPMSMALYAISLIYSSSTTGIEYVLTI